MSKTTHTLLFALMIPALAILAACVPEPADNDYATPATTDVTPAADSMQPYQTMPPADQDTGMAADEMTFAEMDTNQDGGITMDELSPDQMLHQHFGKADANGDGMLSEQEVAQHRADMGM